MFPWKKKEIGSEQRKKESVKREKELIPGKICWKMVISISARLIMSITKFIKPNNVEKTAISLKFLDFRNANCNKKNRPLVIAWEIPHMNLSISIQ